MSQNRKPFEGVLNIIRFNWHFYVIAGIAIIVGMNAWWLLPIFVPSLLFWQDIIFLGMGLAVVYLIGSLLVSHYIYDLSDLYRFQWLQQLHLPKEGHFVNIHSGFDETSHLLQQQFPEATFHLLDFYDPTIHTEVSIQRARKYAPPPAATQSVAYNQWHTLVPKAAVIFGILAIHELRKNDEKVAFLQEVAKALTPTGKFILVEHLRDHNNFLAYGPGFFHFFSKATWLRCIKEARLTVRETFKVTPFIQVFVITLPS